MSPALVIAHRGASATFPENTLEAFRGAAEQGADWVELDARRTADRSLVVHHDALLPDGRPIVELAAADLPPSVPTLAGALDACAGMGVNIEIKNNEPDPDAEVEEFVAEETVALLAQRGGGDEVLISPSTRPPSSGSASGPRPGHGAAGSWSPRPMSSTSCSRPAPGPASHDWFV